jgi:hypothetical protein
MPDVWINAPLNGATVPPSFPVSGGSSPPGCTVTVTLDCGSGPVAFPVNVDISGNWNSTVSTTAGSGTHCTLCAEATDPSTGQKKKVCITIIIGSSQKP